MMVVDDHDVVMAMPGAGIGDCRREGKRNGNNGHGFNECRTHQTVLRIIMPPQLGTTRGTMALCQAMIHLRSRHEA